MISERDHRRRHRPGPGSPSRGTGLFRSGQDRQREIRSSGSSATSTVSTFADGEKSSVTARGLDWGTPSHASRTGASRLVHAAIRTICAQPDATALRRIGSGAASGARSTEHFRPVRRLHTHATGLWAHSTRGGAMDVGQVLGASSIAQPLGAGVLLMALERRGNARCIERRPGPHAAHKRAAPVVRRCPPSVHDQCGNGGRIPGHPGQLVDNPVVPGGSRPA